MCFLLGKRWPHTCQRTPFLGTSTICAGKLEWNEKREAHACCVAKSVRQTLLGVRSFNFSGHQYFSQHSWLFLATKTLRMLFLCQARTSSVHKLCEWELSWTARQDHEQANFKLIRIQTDKQKNRSEAKYLFLDHFNSVRVGKVFNVSLRQVFTLIEALLVFEWLFKLGAKSRHAGYAPEGDLLQDPPSCIFSDCMTAQVSWPTLQQFITISKKCRYQV